MRTRSKKERKPSRRYKDYDLTVSQEVGSVQQEHKMQVVEKPATIVDSAGNTYYWDEFGGKLGLGEYYLDPFHDFGKIIEQQIEEAAREERPEVQFYTVYPAQRLTVFNYPRIPEVENMLNQLIRPVETVKITQLDEDDPMQDVTVDDEGRYKVSPPRR